MDLKMTAECHLCIIHPRPDVSANDRGKYRVALVSDGDEFMIWTLTPTKNGGKISPVKTRKDELLICHDRKYVTIGFYVNECIDHELVQYELSFDKTNFRKLCKHSSTFFDAGLSTDLKQTSSDVDTSFEKDHARAGVPKTLKQKMNFLNKTDSTAKETEMKKKAFKLKRGKSEDIAPVLDELVIQNTLSGPIKVNVKKVNQQLQSTSKPNNGDTAVDRFDTISLRPLTRSMSRLNLAE